MRGCIQAYPISFKLLPKDRWRYPSYKAWRDAGLAIPAIQQSLLTKFWETRTFDEKRQLLHALGAVPDDAIVRFLLDRANDDSADIDLRVAAVWLGLWPNLDRIDVRDGILELVQRQTLDAETRCELLEAVLSCRYAPAIGYAPEGRSALLNELSAIEGKSELAALWRQRLDLAISEAARKVENARGTKTPSAEKPPQ